MKNNTLFFIICVLFFVLFPSFARSEFYEFVDENGVKVFTDDRSCIPPSRMDAVQVHKEPYDDLTEEERQRRMEAEAARLEEIKRQQAEEWENYQQEKRLKEQEKEEAERNKEPEKETTPVVITKDNQILVPVSIGYRGKTEPANLLLDTGANMTVIHDDIAERLGIDGGRRGHIIVADGAKVKTRRVPVEFITVGPKTVSDPKITVLTYTRKEAPFDGLLGLDFLRRFKFTIDYEKSAIVWNE